MSDRFCDVGIEILDHYTFAPPVDREKFMMREKAAAQAGAKGKDKYAAKQKVQASAKKSSKKS